MSGRTTHRSRTGSCSANTATDGVKFTTVQASAVQFADGRIDDGSVYETPHVYLGDDALSSVQARELAAALIGTADGVDRWAARERSSTLEDVAH